MPLRATHPHGRHAVGHYQQGAIEDGTELRISLSLHYAVHARHAYIPSDPILNRTLNYGAGTGQVNRINTNAQKIRFWVSRRIVRFVQRECVRCAEALSQSIDM